MNISDEAVEAANKAFRETALYDDALMNALEAAAPILLSHERQQTEDAHRDAIVNRDTADRLETEIQKLREESKKLRDATSRRLMAEAWEEGRLDGWEESRSGYENAFNPYAAGAGE
jgi:hypothetical protein